MLHDYNANFYVYISVIIGENQDYCHEKELKIINKSTRYSR